MTQFDHLAAAPFPFVRVSAILLQYFDSAQQLHVDAQYPVGIRIGLINSFYNPGNIGGTNFVQYMAVNYQQPDPNGSVFRRLSLSPDQAGQPLLPIVVYRQQVTNANFARVSGNLTQVTPLMEKIPWEATYFNANPLVSIPDRLIAMGLETWSDEGYRFLYLRDQQPVIFGAKYQYYAVRLNAQREVSEVIDARRRGNSAHPMKLRFHLFIVTLLSCSSLLRAGTVVRNRARVSGPRRL